MLGTQLYFHLMLRDNKEQWSNYLAHPYTAICSSILPPEFGGRMAITIALLNGQSLSQGQTLDLELAKRLERPTKCRGFLKTVL
jgi:hypothetical protein